MLFDNYFIKDLVLKNRIVLSPMCQYKACDNSGEINEWHKVHLLSRAIGGAGLIFTEMTNIEPNGRITEQCLGLYNEKQMKKFKSLITEIHSYDAKVGIQLAHAGRKSKIENSDIVSASSIPFSEEYKTPRELNVEEIHDIIEKFKYSAELAVEAGFDTIEIHAAHGYLLHQFISRSSNKRKDEYANPTRLTVEVIRAIKSVIPKDMPLFLRISAVEYNTPPGYSFEEMLDYCNEFIEAGVDVLDVSTGANSPDKPEVYPGYQAKYAIDLADRLNVSVMSVGQLDSPELAEYLLRDTGINLICIGKGMLKEPYWAKKASIQLGEEHKLPGVYEMGF
ncbi:NADPH dehydrogenase [Salinicoccus roseus]|uniref:oxidoreductase n=1 Tax=Salinicoccus roseus TaxID=45670 RepID=UPI002301868C|nr:NADPH dehydrogenase [Salinicoccus roseus]